MPKNKDKRKRLYSGNTTENGCKELASVQPIEGKGWVMLMEFFERNPGVGFYFTSKKR